MKVMKVKIIGFHKSQGKLFGTLKYPDFDLLDCMSGFQCDPRAVNKWVPYLKLNGGTHLLNFESDMYTCTVDSPIGEDEHLFIAPDAFVTEACERFPDICTELSDAEAQVWYDTKHGIIYPEYAINKDIVDSIKTKKDLGIPLTSSEMDAIDPNTKSKGISLNPKRSWALFKEERTGLSSKMKKVK